MDNTETYIKMCDCPEIQAMRPHLARGNYIANRKLGKADLRTTNYPIPKNLIWLPRQDQLQEMLGFHSNEAMLFMFHEFTCTPIHNVVNFVWHHHKSMEQLWLAFVMKSLYQKTWDGEKWC